MSEARVKRGLSQADVATTLGMSRPTFVKIENGTKSPTVVQAKLLSEILGLEVGIKTGVMGESSEDAVAKYRQMVLNSIRFGSANDGLITKVKLAKLVYLADFLWFYDRLTPMSGMTYRKLSYGPVPDIYFRTLSELVDEGVISQTNRGSAQMFSLVEPVAPRDRISDDEYVLIQEIGKSFASYDTSSIVDFTHEQLPWQISRNGDEIAYSLITQEDPERVYGPVKLPS
jgi:transcriptional regulator with XRE-family HTH domain